MDLGFGAVTYGMLGTKDRVSDDLGYFAED